MPFYDYECRCGKKFEVMRKISDDSPQLCPKCGAVAQRLISRTSFVLKKGGCGWADTSYCPPPPKEKKP